MKKTIIMIFLVFVFCSQASALPLKFSFTGTTHSSYGYFTIEDSVFNPAYSIDFIRNSNINDLSFYIDGYHYGLSSLITAGDGTLFDTTGVFPQVRGGSGDFLMTHLGVLWLQGDSIIRDNSHDFIEDGYWQTTSAVVPEPSTFILSGIGFAALVALRRKKTV